MKVRRVHKDELPGLELIKRAVLQELGQDALPLELELNPSSVLLHLNSYDPDGLLCVLDKDETLGFAASHVRSKQWVLSELWVLPQHQGRGAGSMLLKKSLAYAERSGASSYMALVPSYPSIQALLLRFGFKPVLPVYEIQVGSESAEKLMAAVGNRFPVVDFTNRFLNQMGQADLDRLDGLVRGIRRPMDHLFWVKQGGSTLYFVLQGDRVAAYGHAVGSQVGPICGSTKPAATTALAQCLVAATENSEAATVLIPAAFEEAVDRLLTAGGRIISTSFLFARQLGRVHLDRWVPFSHSLP